MRALPALELLRTVWSQHYHQVDGHMQWLPAKEYEGATRIQTPYDPEARWSEKHGKGWLGDKVQVTETDDADAPHLLTDIAVTSSVETDHTAFPQILERQQTRDVLPGERYVDRGYTSGGNFALSATYAETLLGYAPGRSTPQSRMPGGLTHNDFQINLIAATVTCPGGYATLLRPHKKGTLVAEFSTDGCALCRLKPLCCTGKDGRRITLSPDYAALAAARQRQQTEHFKQQYNAHRGGVEACLSALVRGQGYPGQPLHWAHEEQPAGVVHRRGGQSRARRRLARWLPPEKAQAPLGVGRKREINGQVRRINARSRHNASNTAALRRY